MTNEEMDLVYKVKSVNFKKNKKLSIELLDFYFRLWKVIMSEDEADVKMGLREMVKVMEMCQKADAEHIKEVEKGVAKKKMKWTDAEIEQFRAIYWNCMKHRAFWVFEDFMVFMERKRPYNKKFYEPRKCTLKQVAEDLQALEMNEKQKMYGLSLPSRVGKSTICLFFLCWVGLRKPNSHSAMGGHSGLLAKGFYKELLNFIATDEYEFELLYRWHHPEYADKPVITDKSAEDLTITLGEADRFATITCRGIDGTWTGAVDISGGDYRTCGYLYVDDLVRDREHSLNPVRMENTWQEYLNKMVDRKNDGAKELMVGTLWNIYDPLCRLKDVYANDPNYVFRRIPALDDNTDESNFNYDVCGFSTQYYREMRERLDEAEWSAKFQQNPQIREGILFSRESLRRFMIIPEEGITEAYCDPALGGGDFLSMPIERYSDGDTKYKIIDWVYDPSSPKTTVPRMVDKVIQWHITKITIEINGGAGQLVNKELKDELLKRDCGWCELVPKNSSTRLSKEDKIKGRSDFIKDNFEFLEDISPNMTQEYKKALSDTCIYTTMGKNLHDDAPDSLAGLALEHRPFNENGVVYIPDINPFRGFGGHYGY